MSDMTSNEIHCAINDAMRAIAQRFTARGQELSARQSGVAEESTPFLLDDKRT